MEVKFSSVTTPPVGTQHTLRYRIKGDGNVQLVISLYCATTLIKSWTHNPAPAGYTTFGQPLTTAEAASIADYTDLRLRAVAG